MPARMLYAFIMSIFFLVPTLLILVALALLASYVPALSAFQQRLAHEWTLLPFILYITNLMTPFYEDVYRGLEPYQLLFTLILLGGAWAYLRSSRAPKRLAALLLATLLAGIVLALGVYLIYPLQSWVSKTSFPRWWEGLQPLVGTLAMLISLSLISVFGARLRQGELPKRTVI